MDQIPLSPFEMPPEPEHPRPSSPRAPKRRSMFGKVFRGVGWLGATPVQWMGVGNIRQGASFVGVLAARVRARSARDPRFKTADQGCFDLRATAFTLGISVAELEGRLAARRKQTAITAYMLAALGIVFFAGWLFKVLATLMTAGRLVLALDFLPLCLLFVLLVFYQALMNFQIRVGRTAGWQEYLTTESGFWPRA